MSGLTNGQLETLGKKMFKNNFSGVYPSDSTPHISKNNHNISIIFNLSKHNKPGTHYVAVIKKKNKILYFDSYGKKLANTSIKTYLKSFSLPIYYSKIKIQHKNSIFCGLFTLSYIKGIQIKNMTHKKYYDMFHHPPTLKNDKIVTEFLTDEIKNN